MTKFCPECGFKQHNDNNRYCSNCGFDFSKLEEIESNSNGSEVAGINLIDDSEDTSVNVPIIDLEDSEDSNPFASEPSHSVSHADDSNSTGSSSVDSNSTGSSSSSSPNSVDSKPKITVSNSSSNSNRKRKTNANQKAKSKKSSDWSFNKCFVTIAAFLIILVIFGLITEAFQPEPYSDRGITSFMDKSINFNLNDFLDETSNGNVYFNPDDVLGNGVAIINYFSPSKSIF